ncbi:MAG: Zn-dependent protease [Acidobacteria bacterium]|nr:MAG: Zn-dependent protease [Acidobacteriota bacterium]
MAKLLPVLLFLLASFLIAAPSRSEPSLSRGDTAGPASGPMAHTFSIVARDPKTGEMGVAVQSHWFSVGSLVSWAEAGVGAVATQSIVEVSYGPKGLALMRAGKSAPEALKELLTQDEQRDVRQVAMVDALGQVAAWTGRKCIPAAGDQQGGQFSVEANLMSNDRVWPAMKTAFEAAEGDLADRMLAALDAAQAAGGDIRGKQSAAILIVSGERSAEPWKGKLIDLRVEDSPRPLEELRRLVGVQRAYRYADQGDAFVSLGKIDDAMKAYARAAELQPANNELAYWRAVGLWNAGKKPEAIAAFRKVFARDRRWAALTPRLVPVGLLAATPEELKKILGRLS